MIKIHHLEDSRSQRILWLLEELGLDYEVIRYERDPETRLAPDALRAVHPLGKSPILEEDDIIVAETGAIIEYVIETHGGGRLKPAKGTPEARAWTYWMHYAEGSAMPPLLMKLVFQMLPQNANALVRPMVKAIASRTQDSFIDPRVREHVEFWDSSLAPTGWFAGDAFTAADIIMSFPLEAAADRSIAGQYPNISGFLTRIHERPAYQRALERGGPYAYA
ncbi:MAG: glutathione S-transferase [Henriciella sp.]|jgi:glutathione S-transferase|uniref:glutathione S-transferase family protein n=1 Tax=Henriciella sp. TaxID=1968823 RepID=UPI000C0E058D|nr:glutathione S-transferase [Henriciella sp.]MAN73433.1 glutathione S-transferase [Henriciella sp.]MBF33600.1 glutathione S-transferase [Hyphomonadaceae bacterium]MBK74561.1 glutathione S-transferase [Henriciella sp.]PHR77508.1 MAG: glutathione S-transferase [Henriciella sp.]|tara:strand:+ start:1775 stop:2437 length:663 start_codon:yes stop_codon:yes gene_type:complete